MEKYGRTSNTQHHLHRLDNLGSYKVHKNDPDVRGWTVVTSDRQPIGKVESLIADTDAKKVRYLEIDVDNKLANNRTPLEGKQPGTAGTTHVKVSNDGNQRLIVPIGVAQIPADKDEVVIGEIGAERLHSAPRLNRFEPITPGHELDVRRHLFDSGSDTQQFKRWEDRRNTTDRWGDSFYDEKYNADRIYMHRRGS